MYFIFILNSLNMNKLIKQSTFLAVILLAACSSEEPIVTEGSTNNAETSNCNSALRSEAEVLDAASRALSILDDNVAISRTQTRHIDFSIKPQVILTKSKSRGNSSDTLMYVVNYVDSMGYAVIAAHRNAPELIAVTEQGYYDPQHPGENEGFNLFMSQAENYLASISIGGGGITPPITPVDPIPAPEYKTERDTVILAEVPQRVKVLWGQTNYEGKEFANGIVGCSNLATAMIMSYFEYPTTMTLTYKVPSYDINIDWISLKKHYPEGSRLLVCMCDKDTHLQLAQICREIGFRSNSNDTAPNGTSTTPANSVSTLYAFGFNLIARVPSYRTMTADLNSYNSVLLVHGFTSDNKGHAWICDGTKAYDYITNRYIWEKKSPMEVIPKWELIDTQKTSMTLNHYNWGWYGLDNGYFNDQVFTAPTTGQDFSTNILYFVVYR